MNKVTRIKNANYTTISNVFLRDKKLSLKAKGLLATILSLPENWDFSIKGICATIKEGTTAVYSAIDELKERGYCKVVTNRNEKGMIVGNDYTFYEDPNMENLNVGNQAQINTNISLPNTKDTNNKEINKEEDTIVSSKKNDYQAIVDCWNEYNGKKLGKVTKVTERRKKAIKKALDDNGITQEQLMLFFKTLPLADKWLYNPNKQHENWKPDFDWWLSNPNGWLTKGLEGKVHLENPQAYSSIMLGKDAPYTPICDGALSWNDYYTCFMYVGYWDGKHIPDGYSDDNRPNGASVTLNNGRGIITWDSETKKWNKV